MVIRKIFASVFADLDADGRAPSTKVEAGFVFDLV
jgi:hypothetical protein